MNTRGFWRRMRATDGDPRRLPGTLADEKPAAGRWEPRMPVTEAVQREMAQLLLERDTETQRADRAETRLRAAEARIHGLELTVAASAGHTCDTAVMPRVRSHPAPGAMRIADGELLIVPLPGEAGR